jgi:hypothetical protein
MAPHERGAASCHGIAWLIVAFEVWLAETRLQVLAGLRDRTPHARRENRGGEPEPCRHNCVPMRWCHGRPPRSVERPVSRVFPITASEAQLDECRVHPV